MLKRASLIASIALAAAPLLSCSKGSSAPQPANGFELLTSDCDPLVPSHCGFPFPSNVWRVKSGDTYAIHFGATTLPNLKGTRPTDPHLWEDRDGFAVAQAMLTQMPGATTTGLPDENHLDASVQTTSPTIIMNADTGELIPNIAELDQWATSDDQRSLLIHPMKRLNDGTRYLVAIRHVVDASGNALAPSPAFQALRDKTASSEGSVELRRDLYEDIFGKLAAAGIARADLQLAWDFTTATQDNTQRDLLAMRDQALAALPAGGPQFTINSVDVAPNQYIAARLHGSITVPLFLKSTDESATMNRDPATGLPKQNGTATFDFLVHIPNSCTTTKQCAVVQNGHGLLGDMTEGQDGYLAQFCGQFHYVGLALNWYGFAAPDLGAVITSVSDDPSAFPTLVEHQEQGMINNLIAMRMMKTSFLADPHVQAQDGSGPIYDNSLLFYRGDSQGGIFGSTYMSVSTDVTRGLLGEPGMPYNLLLDRSVDFESYRSLLDGALPDARDEELFLDLLQVWWDRVEPSGYTNILVNGDGKNTPAHRVLMHAAIGDQQVTTLGAHLLARELGAVNLKATSGTPLVNREIYGVTDADGPLTSGSALVEFSFGLAPNPVMNLPPDCQIPELSCGNIYDDDPHDTVRSEPDAMQMADTFFRTGTISMTCDGVCDPE